MKKIFEEVFESPFKRNTEDDALKVLDEIRAMHDAEHGWVEIYGYAEKLQSGQWRAVRKHAKYA